MLSTSISNRVFETQTKQTCEIQLARRDGAQFYAQLESEAVQDESGQFSRCRTMVSDISERKKAEDDLAGANREWARTFNSISDLVMVLDNQHKILRANKAMADTLGMTEQEVIGKFCFELVHGADEPPVFCPYNQLFADGEEHRAEVAEPLLGGIYDVRVSPLISENGQVIGSVHITRDITARKKTEESLRQSESMLSGVIQAAPDRNWCRLRAYIQMDK